MPKPTLQEKFDLNDRQASFVQEYLVDLNATRAAVRAGYSIESARFIGAENLTKPNIVEAIAEAMHRRSERTEITQDKVLRELAAIGFSSPRDVMSWSDDGVRVKDSAELTDAEAAIVSEVSDVNLGDGARGIKIKLNSKLDALKAIGQHLGMFKQTTVLTGPDGKPIQVEVTLSDTEYARRIAFALAKGLPPMAEQAEKD